MAEKFTQEEMWTTAALLNKVGLWQRSTGKWLIGLDTRLLWENVLDTKNDYKFPTQYSNLTKVLFFSKAHGVWYSACECTLTTLQDPEVPSVSGGVLWPDTTNKLFYLFGGEYETTNDVKLFTTLWLYDVIYNTWNRSSASDGSLTDMKWPALGASTVTDTGTAYYYGGYITNLSMPEWSGEPLMLNSLASFNMNTRTWLNHTYDQTPRAEGVLHFIPASSDGMLVYFGGLETNNGVVDYVSLGNIVFVFGKVNALQANMSVSGLLRRTTSGIG